MPFAEFPSRQRSAKQSQGSTQATAEGCTPERQDLAAAPGQRRPAAHYELSCRCWQSQAFAKIVSENMLLTGMLEEHPG